MKAHYKRHVLKFKRPGGTSRGILKEKETWFLFLTDGKKTGVGECGLFRGLSVDDRPDYEDQLKDLCERINQNETVPVTSLKSFPSILEEGIEPNVVIVVSRHYFIHFG